MRFARADELKRHMRTPTKEKHNNFECRLCGEKFARRDHLNLHSQRWHKILLIFLKNKSYHVEALKIHNLIISLIYNSTEIT